MGLEEPSWFFWTDKTQVGLRARFRWNRVTQGCTHTVSKAPRQVFCDYSTVSRVIDGLLIRVVGSDSKGERYPIVWGPYKIGIVKAVLDALDDLGITITLHLWSFHDSIHGEQCEDEETDSEAEPGPVSFLAVWEFERETLAELVQIKH